MDERGDSICEPLGSALTIVAEREVMPDDHLDGSQLADEVVG